MKNILLKSLTIVFTYFAQTILAQQFAGIIKYNFAYNYSGMNNSIPAYLYFNTQKSLFDYDKLAYMRKEDSLEVSVSMGDKPTKRKRDAYGQMYIMDKKTNTLYFREFIYRKPYISQEQIPIIPWQLKNEAKTIAGYVCKKAEATFRGRKYTAWYTSAIPVSVGPWKLQGLPGAILEAKSEDGEVSFEAESIRIPADVQKELSIQELPDGKVVSYQEYLQAFEKERKEELQRVTTLFSAIQEKAKQDGMLPKDIPTSSPNGFRIGKMFTIEKYE